MSARSNTLLAALYTAENRSVDGATRLQKLVFLAQQETGVGTVFDFEPGDYGPFSVELAGEADRLIAEGYISQHTVQNAIGNPKHKYALEPKGIRFAKKLVDQYRGFFHELSSINKKYGDWRLKRLLSYVYEEYPEYTSETKLDTDRLHDPDARSQFLEPGRESEYEQLAEIKRIRGEITSTGETFERAQVELAGTAEITIEQFEDGQVAVYWTTSAGIDEFLQRLTQDSRVTHNSPAEARFVEMTGWIQASQEDILSKCTTRDDCAFIAVASADGEYEVTWDNFASDEDEQAEITVLFSDIEHLNESDIQSVLNRYLRNELQPTEQISSEQRQSISPASFNQSLRETANYLLG
jgi:uncharacterized protein YwgA